MDASGYTAPAEPVPHESARTAAEILLAGFSDAGEDGDGMGSLTIVGLGGETLLGPEEYARGKRVQHLRERLHDKMMKDYHAEPVHPWQTGKCGQISISKDGEDLSDDSLLDGDLELTAAVIEVDMERKGPSIDDLIKGIEVERGTVLGLYVHGSCVWGHKAPEDVDLLCIVNDGVDMEDRMLIQNYDVSFIALSTWRALMRNMDPTVLVTLSLPPVYVFRKLEDDCMETRSIDLKLLRYSVLTYADAKWISAVFAGIQENEWGPATHEAAKVLAMAFRKVMLGIQWARDGKVVDPRCANKYYSRAIQVMKFWGGTKVTGGMNRYFQKRGHGWDVVNAIFAREFEDLVAEFLEATEEIPPAAKERPKKVGSDSCSICKEALKDSSEPVCTPVNCNHSVHVKCIIRYIAKFDLYYDYSSAPEYPAVKCPCCSESFRPIHSDERVRNRSELLKGAGTTYQGPNTMNIWLPYAEVSNAGYYGGLSTWPAQDKSGYLFEGFAQDILDEHREMMAQGASDKELREFARQKSKTKEKHHKDNITIALAKEHAHDVRTEKKAHKHDHGHSHAGGEVDKTGAYARQFSAGLGSLDEEEADEEAEMLARFRQKQLGRQSFADLDDTSGKLKEIEEGAPIPRNKK